MRVFLKCKIKSLAVEATIIRHEERRYKPRVQDDPTYVGLYEHRINAVRPEARSALLAYGMIRGRRYLQIERFCYVQPDEVRVRDLVVKYGGIKKADAVDMVHTWLREEHTADTEAARP